MSSYQWVGGWMLDITLSLHLLLLFFFLSTYLQAIGAVLGRRGPIGKGREPQVVLDEVEDVAVAVPKPVHPGLDRLPALEGERVGGWVGGWVHEMGGWDGCEGWVGGWVGGFSLPTCVFHPATKPPTEGPASSKVTSYSSCRWAKA